MSALQTLLLVTLLVTSCTKTEDQLRKEILEESPPPSATNFSGAASLQEMYDFYGATDEYGNPALEGGDYGEEVGLWDKPGWYRLTVRIDEILAEGAAVVVMADRTDLVAGVVIPCDDDKPIPYAGPNVVEFCARLSSTVDGSPGWIVAGAVVYWPEGPQFFNLEP